MKIQILLILITILIQFLFNCYENNKHNSYSNIINCVFSLITSILSLHLSYVFLQSEIHFLKINVWFCTFNLEPLGLIFLSMLSLLWLITNIYACGYLHLNPEINSKKFNIFTTLSIFSAIMIAFSNSLIIMFAFYELLTISTYPLIANTNTKHEKNEARFYLYFLITTSSIILLPAIIFIGINFGTTEFTIGGITKDYQSHTIIPLLIITLYGTAKAAIIPSHFWLPRAMVAPIPTSAILHAVAVVKSGIFILLKMYIYIFGIHTLQNISSWHNTNIITILSASSLIIASIAALYQTTIKKLLAYSTINQLSMCVLAASLFTSQGITASILHMISHAFAKISLFFAVGYIYCNARISNISDIGGIYKKLPLTTILFSISALSIIGLPPFGGFISKAYIFYAAIDQKMNYLTIIALIISVLLSTQYFGTMIYKMYFQTSQVKNRAVYSEIVTSPMLIATLITTALVCMYIFLYPYIILLINRIQF